MQALFAFAAFCGMSGAIYAFNDIRDRHDDREHAIKRFRPIASGTLSVRTAASVALVLGMSIITVSAWLNWQFAAVLTGYAITNVAYSMYFKRIAFIDVGFITGGFLLRVLAGAVAIAVPVSGWLLVCTALLAAFLGFGKRLHELVQTAREDKPQGTTRTALRGYNQRLLRWVLMALAAATCAAYALYALDIRTIAAFGTRKLLWTLPFCVIGILRFLQLAMWRTQKHSPTEQILRDWPFLANMLVWGAAVLAIVYGSG